MDTTQWTERRAVRWTLYAVAAVLAVHAAAAVALVLLQRGHEGRVLPPVELDGVAVGGLTADELIETGREHAAERLREPVVLTIGDDDIEVPRAELGAVADVAPALHEAWDRGRRGFWLALRDQVSARLGATRQVDLAIVVPDEDLDTWAARTADELSQEPRRAAVTFNPDDDEVAVEVTEPRTGRTVAADALVDEVAPVAVEPGRTRIEVPAETTGPDVTQSDLDAVLPEAEQAVSAPVRLTNPAGGDDLELAPTDLAEVLEITADPDAPEGERLRVTSSGERLRDHLGDDAVAALGTDPVDATVSLEDGQVVIEDDTPGFEAAVGEAADLIVELATDDGDREAELPGNSVDADLTREGADDLGIEEEVSSFTTDLVPGQPRNTNIQLGAEILDGALILPGETFSLNEAVGPRTAERGFVENGYIDEGGEVISVTGGGSSQLGTTFMNAAWFAGIRLLEFQPHSYYFSRYPMGREATLSYSTIDVVVENDSPYGILIEAGATNSSVTISFWSSPWAEVDTWTGDPTNHVSGRVRDGFDVSFGRTITYPDGSDRSEDYSHRYRPED